VGEKQQNNLEIVPQHGTNHHEESTAMVSYFKIVAREKSEAEFRIFDLGWTN
jgi:hypothetical protein